MRPRGGRLVASLGICGASWAPLGASLGPLWGLLGPLGAFLGPLGALWRRKARFLIFWFSSWAPLGAFLGPFWAVLGASWAVLGPSWAVLGPSWGPLWPSWSGLRGLLGRRGASESRKSQKAKNIEKNNEIQRFWLLRALLGGLLEASWGVLTAPWAVWRPSWASWIALGPSRTMLSSLGGALGALLERSWEPAGTWPGPSRDLAGTLPGYFWPGDPQGPPRARELENC